MPPFPRTISRSSRREAQAQLSARETHSLGRAVVRPSAQGMALFIFVSPTRLGTVTSHGGYLTNI